MAFEQTGDEDLRWQLPREKLSLLDADVPLMGLRVQRIEIAVDLRVELRRHAAELSVITTLAGEQRLVRAPVLLLAGHLKRDDLVQLRRKIHLDFVGGGAGRFGDRQDLPAHSRGASADDNRQDQQGEE